MHAVIRRYKVRLGTVAGAAHHAETSLLPQMNRLPGFVAYYLLDAGDSVLASISVCESAEGADAAAALAGGRRRTERRGSSDRRADAERREGLDRRRADVPPVVERRSTSRRSVTARRSDGERRAAWQSTPRQAPPQRRSGPLPQRRSTSPVA